MTHESSGAESAPFRRFSRHIVHLRWLVVGLSLAATVSFGLVASKHLLVDTSAESLLSSKSEVVASIVRLWNDFGQDKLLLVQAEGEVFSLTYLDRLRALQRDIEALDVNLPTLGQSPEARLHALQAHERGAPKTAPVEADGWGDEAKGSPFESVTSLINVRDVRASESGIVVRGLLDAPPSEAELPRLRERVLGDPSLVGSLVGRRGQHALIVARTAFMSPADGRTLTEAVRKIVAKHQRAGFALTVTGVPALEGELDYLTMRDAGLVFGAALLLMFVLLGVLFRSFVAVLGPIFVILQAVVWMLGAMALGHAPLTAATNLLSTLLLCVGIGESVHVQSLYREARKRGANAHDAVVETVASTAVPVVYTSLTTMLGLLSFVSSDIGSVRDMGVYGAVGIGFTLVLSLTFLPAFLAICGRPMSRPSASSAPRDDLVDWLLARANVLAGAHDRRLRNRTLVGAGLAAMLALVGMSQLRALHDPLSWFPERMGVRRDVLDVDANIGGSTTVSVLIAPKSGKTFADRELLLALERFEQHALAYTDDAGRPIVSGVSSLLTLVRATNQALHGDDLRYRTIPASDDGVRDVLLMLEMSGRAALSDFMTLDRKQGLVTVRVRWREASEYRALGSYLARGAQVHLGAFDVQLTGTIFAMIEVVNDLIDSLVKSGLWSVLTVTALLIFMLGNVKLGLLAMIPNVLPIACVLGMMGFLGIPLNLANVMIASIVLSFAVDDTVHFMHQFRVHHAEHRDPEAAIAHAFSHSGRAAVSTSFVVGGGFLVCLFASLSIWQDFGLLIALAVFIALAAELLLSPALLRLAYGRTDEAPRALTSTTIVPS